ncbi:hypothetical protein [Vannielia sp.]|uniref:hypothetical protein n=1 Tax=Vannielia sp. TaxID=2813045 RepID=UPI002610DED7|nr:hypothetical protein [Vannielia sp.]MDF1871828.1 hypothetical protein [Vannielia sp.]
MPFKEVTHCVQRFEMLEERAGIEIGGLMVTVDDEPDSEGEYKVSVMAEITAAGGSSISADVEININCYNANRQLCGSVSAYLEADNFFGIETLSETVYAKAFPVELKIIPKIT